MINSKVNFKCIKTPDESCQVDLQHERVDGSREMCWYDKQCPSLRDTNAPPQTGDLDAIYTEYAPHIFALATALHKQISGTLNELEV